MPDIDFPGGHSSITFLAASDIAGEMSTVGRTVNGSCVFHTAGRLIPNSDVGLFRHSYHQIFYSRFWYDIMSTVILSVSLKSKCFDSMRSIRFVFIGIRPASRQWSAAFISSVSYWQSKVCSEDIGFSVFLEFV